MTAGMAPAGLGFLNEILSAQAGLAAVTAIHRGGKTRLAGRLESVKKFHVVAGTAGFSTPPTGPTPSFLKPFSNL
jgi:hypothetical protein